MYVFVCVCVLVCACVLVCVCVCIVVTFITYLVYVVPGRLRACFVAGWVCSSVKTEHLPTFVL